MTKPYWIGNAVAAKAWLQADEPWTCATPVMGGYPWQSLAERPLPDQRGHFVLDFARTNPLYKNHFLYRLLLLIFGTIALGIQRGDSRVIISDKQL
ncbi:hypothetical protein [Methylobacterium sp. 190mf]|uniref:hypothetical protein n=1 Tax=Methylobacterium sp. 190mf TaxID=1761798 RepID=UPI0011B04F14|nr:hypothetical protein [Methylobacterium sp. 190mf]